MHDDPGEAVTTRAVGHDEGSGRRSDLAIEAELPPEHELGERILGNHLVGREQR